MSDEPARSARDRELERRAYQLFGELLAMASAERAAALDASCAGNAELRAEVEALLEADSGTTWLLDGQAVDLASGVWSGEPEDDHGAGDLGPGKVLGAYRLGPELGVGGMGRVFAGRRVDGTLDRLVAIKVLKAERGMGSDRERQFLDEGRALASLQHRHIARVFEASVDPDLGLPYLVMEHIDGRSITEHCQWADLELDARVDLAIDVCEAVAAAHDQRLVHRDLKPSNVLVDRHGHVKLLDFGIARFLDRPTDEAARLPMTPAYAAPEQAHGGPITPATDVYALGLLIYEMLTGQQAVDLRDVTPGEIVRRIDESDPPPPSMAFGDGPADTSTPLARLRRQLRGDLDTIVMKAVRKVAEQRYRSARELADDLRRWRTGRPVLARPVGPIERCRKFARRHRLAVAVAAWVAVTLLVSAAVLSWQRHRADVDRTLAERETETAEQVSELVRWLFEASSPSEALGVDAPALDLLASGVERVEATESPAVRAELFLVLGRAYANLGSVDRAVELFDRARDAGTEAGSSALVATIAAERQALVAVGEVP